MNSTITDAEKPPQPRNAKSRLPDEAKTLEVNQYIDVHDARTAACVRALGRYNGWQMVQRKDARSIRIWRLE